MSNYPQEPLEHCIPTSVEVLIEALEQAFQNRLSPQQQAEFRIFCQRLQWYYRANQTSELETVRSIYLPYAPESLQHQLDSAPGQPEPAGKLDDALSGILRKANFIELSEHDLNQALTKTSPHGVEVSIDIDQYETLMIWYRGLDTSSHSQRTLRSLYIKKTQITVPIYRKLFLLVQKPQPDSVGTAGKALAPVHIKLFRDIPLSDLEMLFPDTRVKIRLFDKLKLSVTGGGGTVAGAATGLGKLSAAVDPVAIVMAIGGFAAIVWRQVSKIFSQRTKYLMNLSRRLYFYNLDNNLGAITHLADMARGEELKEALLAYSFLLFHQLEDAETPVDRKALDKRIEKFLSSELGLQVDFDVDDGLNKLLHLTLVEDNTDKGLAACPLHEANFLLSEAWQALLP